MKTSASVRRGMHRAAPLAGRRVGPLMIGLSAFVMSQGVEAARPGGSPGPGSKTPPNPDIVYLSASSQSLSVGVRGVTLSDQSGTLTSADGSLQRNTTNRSSASVAWSPDGTRYAWIENGAIFTAAPGGKPTLLYPTDAAEPRPLSNPDSLAWGPACCGQGDSTLAFLSELPSYAVEALTIEADVVVSRERLYALESRCDASGTCTLASGGAFSFSPRGHWLAFFGMSSDLSPGLWAIPMGGADHTPALIASRAAVGGTLPGHSVLSIDWSPDGTRLALSVITSPDPQYPWTDLRIVDLNYSWNGAFETVSLGGVRSSNPGSGFGEASSEHSPTWDPDPATQCQRLAFSQSSDAGRAMYVVDLAGASSCVTTIRPIVARYPRALDWRLKQ